MASSFVVRCSSFVVVVRCRCWSFVRWLLWTVDCGLWTVDSTESTKYPSTTTHARHVTHPLTVTHSHSLTYSTAHCSLFTVHCSLFTVHCSATVVRSARCCYAMLSTLCYAMLRRMQLEIFTVNQHVCCQHANLLCAVLTHFTSINVCWYSLFVVAIV